MIDSTAPILDWHLNEGMPEAVSILAEARVAELLTPASPDPIYRQLDLNWPSWKVWGPSPAGGGWELLPGDYLYSPTIGTLLPAAMAWLRSEKITVYKYNLICIIQLDDSFTVGRIM